MLTIQTTVVDQDSKIQSPMLKLKVGSNAGPTREDTSWHEKSRRGISVTNGIKLDRWEEAARSMEVQMQ